MSGGGVSGSKGQLIGLAAFVIPLVVIGLWVWEETPEGALVSGGEGGDQPRALEIALSRPGAGFLRVSFANASSRKITIVVPGRPTDVLRIVKVGVPAGSPRRLSFRAERDALVELLPKGTYNQLYPTNAAGPVEAIYDSRGSGLPARAWRGIARSGAPEEGAGGRKDTNGG